MGGGVKAGAAWRTSRGWADGVDRCRGQSGWARLEGLQKAGMANPRCESKQVVRAAGSLPTAASQGLREARRGRPIRVPPGRPPRRGIRRLGGRGPAGRARPDRPGFRHRADDCGPALHTSAPKPPGTAPRALPPEALPKRHDPARADRPQRAAWTAWPGHRRWIRRRRRLVRGPNGRSNPRALAPIRAAQFEDVARRLGLDRDLRSTKGRPGTHRAGRSKSCPRAHVAPSECACEPRRSPRAVSASALAIPPLGSRSNQRSQSSGQFGAHALTMSPASSLDARSPLQGFGASGFPPWPLRL